VKNGLIGSGQSFFGASLKFFICFAIELVKGSGKRILRLFFLVFVIVTVGEVATWAAGTASTALHLGHHLLELSHVHAAGATAESFHTGHAAHAAHTGHAASTTHAAHHSCEALHAGHTSSTTHAGHATHTAHAGHTAGTSHAGHTALTALAAESLHLVGIVSLHSLVTLLFLIVGVDPLGPVGSDFLVLYLILSDASPERGLLILLD
jgi:hypothetical protein